MTNEQNNLPAYPPVEHEDLSMDRVYWDLQQKGPYKAQMSLGEPIWIATRYEDVKTVYGDRRFGKSRGYGRDTPRMHGMALGGDPSRLDNMDPPVHTRVRRLASTAFAPQQIRSMESWIETMTSELLDDVAKAGPGVDFIERFAWKLPLRVITGILGAPESDIPMLKASVDDLTGPASTLDQKMAAYGSMKDYVRGLITARRDVPTDDLLCILVQAQEDDDRFTDDELVNLAMALFLGGFETTAAQIGNVVWTLMSRRELWQELLQDPDLVPNAMEELWRWVPSFRHGQPMIRWADEDVELSDGVVIPAGDPVLPEHMVANRDETVFENAWDIDFHRKEPAPHLSLGWGAHRCMGARLAGLEIESALRALVARFPTLDLAVSPEDVEWSHSTHLRSASTLPITW